MDKTLFILGQSGILIKCSVNQVQGLHSFRFKNWLCRGRVFLGEQGNLDELRSSPGSALRNYCRGSLNKEKLRLLLFIRLSGDVCVCAAFYQLGEKQDVGSVCLRESMVWALLSGGSMCPSEKCSSISHLGVASPTYIPVEALFERGSFTRAFTALPW